MSLIGSRKSFAPARQIQQTTDDRRPTTLFLAGLLQSVALCKTVESKASHSGWQFDSSYSRDKVEFILAAGRGARFESPGVFGFFWLKAES